MPLDGSISINDFLNVLSSKAPVPGGGGASALVSAIGAALVSMTCNLTIGKKKYAEVEDEIIRLNREAEELRDEFVKLIDRDAQSFTPLAQAFKLPCETEEEKLFKQEVLEREYFNACTVPFEIMQNCRKAIEIAVRVADIGSRMVVSDVASGLAFIECALKTASLNIFINTKSMQDRQKALDINAKAQALIDDCSAKADICFNKVLSQLKGE